MTQKDPALRLLVGSFVGFFLLAWICIMIGDYIDRRPCPEAIRIYDSETGKGKWLIPD